MNYTLEMGWDKRLYVVFPNQYERSKADWLFLDIMGMYITSFGEYDNAFGWF